MAILKINASDGALVWKMSYSASSSNGVESVAFTSDGGFVVGGFVGSASPSSEFTFKSGGQVEDGNPWVGKVSAADAAGSTTPASFAWEYTYSGVPGSAKAMRVDSSDNVYAIGGKNHIFKLNSSGAV